MKIAIYAIAKNEATHVERFCDSITDADAIVVADTGSTDDTMERLRARGVAVHSINLPQMRFDDARNTALALVPADIDVCIALDLDEVMVSGWRTMIEGLPSFTRLRYRYGWSHKADGSVDVSYWYDKIHARSGYRWRHPVHELLTPFLIDEVQQHIDVVLVDHWPDTSKDRSQYLPLLELSCRDDPEYAVNAHYLGRELYFAGRLEEAKAELERHLGLSDSAYTRCASMRYLAKICLTRGDHDIAKDWLRKAVITAPDIRDAWVDMAELAYTDQSWRECLNTAETALSIPDGYRNDPRSYGPLPYDVASIAAWHLGDTGKAIRYCEDALALAPTDARFLANREFYLNTICQTG